MPYPNISNTQTTDNNQANIDNAVQPSQSNQIKQALYKTEMCKNWEKSKSCPYQKKCKFAHGREEMQMKDKEKNPNYKRKDCIGFFKYWNCSYGRRCCNKHDERKFNDSENNHFNVLVMLKLVNPNINSKKRLHIFSQITYKVKEDDICLRKKTSLSDSSEDVDSVSTFESLSEIREDEKGNENGKGLGKRQSKCDIHVSVERKISSTLNLYDFVEDC
jgi:hypothetical protein